MAVTASKVRSAETEAKELQKALKAVGDALRRTVAQPGKSGMTYSQFKVSFSKRSK